VAEGKAAPSHGRGSSGVFARGQNAFGAEHMFDVSNGGGGKMIVVTRLHSDGNPDVIWDYIMQNHTGMSERLCDGVKLLYATRRARHNDVSLFMHINDIDAMGEFISNEISRIDSVDALWIIDLINPKFFPVPKGTRPNLPRYTITIHAYPKQLKDVYEAMCAMPPNPDFAVMYVANTFHLFGESIMMSVLARDKELVDGFTSGRIEKIPGVLHTRTYEIMRTHRLLPREEWQKYAEIFPDN
jgi:hypothetical protein